MSEEDEAAPPEIDPLLTVVLAAVAIGGMTDVILDSSTRQPGIHLILELVLILVSLGGVAVIARRWIVTRRSLAVAQKDLIAQRAERDAWRLDAEKVLTGLAREIDRQFIAWQLTAAERETAFSLLKGQSLKRIAKEAGRSERTVRQHAVSVYRKSGLSGRAELSGYFLGDLLLPPGSGSSGENV